MVNYPILSPVSCSLAALVHLGSMERSFAPALDAFSNGPSGLTVPEIETRWQAIRPVPLNPASTRAFVSSARRMIEEAEMLGQFYRNYQEQASPDATVRFSTGHSQEEAQVERLRVRERLQEWTGKISSAARTTWIPGKTPWFLALLNPVQRGTSGAAFVNEDGRSIHLSNLYGDSVLLGYGLFSSAMHYVEINSAAPHGKSRALFLRDQDYRLDPGNAWLLALARSLQNFYSPQMTRLSSKVRVTVASKEQKGPKYESPALDTVNEDEFRDVLRHLGPGSDFTIESEDLIAGRRGSSLSTINTVVPLASIRCRLEGGPAALWRTFYLPDRTNFSGESAIPDEFKKRLRFHPLSSLRAP